MLAQLKFAAAVIWLLLMFSLPVREARAEEEPTGASRELDLIISQALEQNPDLRAAEARRRFFAGKIVQAASLEDPRLSLALANYPTDSFSWNQTPMTGQIVKLSQNLPFPGKLAAKANIAEQQANWYREAYREAKIQLIRQVKEAWYTLYLQERTLERTEAGLSLLDDIIRLAENLYETGKGAQQDILKAQVERSILFEKRLTLRQQRDIALANLNSLRNAPTETAITPPQDLVPQLYPYSLEELQEKAATLRPLARAYQSLVDQYKAQEELARLNYYPDFAIGAAYTFRQPNPGDSGTDFASLEFAVNIPLFQEKRREASAEAAAGAAMARHQRDDFLNKTRLSIHDGFTLMEKNGQLMSLYRSGIIPQATQSLAASVSGYQVGKIAFSTLLDSMLTLYKYEVEYYRTQVDHARSIARLEAEAGLTADPADRN
jgi:cobalt-zinc-cadmium efflux system outer membrane protein